MEKETKQIVFSNDQQEAINLALSGKSFFLTGKAGTGKSTVVNYLRKILGESCVFLATTGVAASNIEGETIHSFFAIRPYGVLTQDAANWVKGYKREIWRKINTIVIDEVSMLRPDVLDCINWTLEKNIHSSLSEYQVIFVGDMKQLPPVYKDEDMRQISKYYTDLTWKGANIVSELNMTDVELEEIKRQTDIEFIAELNKVREGEESVYFHQFNRKNDGIVLAPYNAQVSAYNERMINQLPGEPVVFEANKSDNYKSGSTIAEEKLVLKNGCKVMYLKNDEFFYNGYVGELEITEDNKLKLDGIILEDHTWYTYKYELDKFGNLDIVKDTWITQLPVKPAYALTIHKAQGLTFDEVTIDLTQSTFAKGQLYTALSRVRTPEGLAIKR